MRKLWGYIAIGALTLLIGGGAYAIYISSQGDDGFRGDVAPPEYTFPSTATLERMIAESSLIARVSFRSATPVGVAMSNVPKFSSALRFTFDVHEYLKGAGGSQIVALAYGEDKEDYWSEDDMLTSSKSDAEAKAAKLLEWRDSRWDDREAIVFLRRELDDSGYWLGLISPYEKRITVASRKFKAWLPSATPLTATTTPGLSSNPVPDTQLFLLDDPARVPRVASSGLTKSVGATPTISLGVLKERIRATEEEVAAGDGTDAYRKCVAASYEKDEWIRIEKRRARDIFQPLTDERTMGSGLAAGTVVLDHQSPLYVDGGWEYGRAWHEGRDKDLIRVKRPGYVYVERPLPAGEYWVYYNWQDPELVPCNHHPPELHNSNKWVFTAVAPDGTLAESFFDPYAAGTAVTGTTSVGTIRWQSGQVKATLTQDVTGHVLDFIALDGSASLSLDVADATEDSGTLEWSVASQPWSAGDKLMLRIRRSETPPAMPTPTPP